MCADTEQMSTTARPAQFSLCTYVCHRVSESCSSRSLGRSHYRLSKAAFYLPGVSGAPDVSEAGGWMQAELPGIKAEIEGASKFPMDERAHRRPGDKKRERDRRLESEPIEIV